ncbi:hypothetical protein HC864_04845 [Candidatus Gracilibacteria bacterium]|nr:hypothetical protein [Candidatus Gracilibacteria bacterium]
MPPKVQKPHLQIEISLDEMNTLGHEKSRTVSDFTETLSGLGYNRGLRTNLNSFIKFIHIPKSL